MTTKHQKLVWCFLMIMVIFANACDNYQIIMEGLTQNEANEALVLLRDKNIEAIKEGIASRKSATYQIKVKKSQEKIALSLLVYNQVPRIDRASFKDIYPPGSSGVIPTKSDEMARLTMAMQGEMEALLKVIPGIADARVVFSYEPPRDFGREYLKKTASVALIYRPQKDTSEPPLSEMEIQHLIAASVSGLQPQDVTVVQKLLKPFDYVEKDSPVLKQDAPLQAKNQWFLLGLTFLALIVAGYGVFRLFIYRRSLSS